MNRRELYGSAKSARQWLRTVRDAITVVAALVLVACGGGSEPQQQSADAAIAGRAVRLAAIAVPANVVQVQGLVLKAERRISRVVFEYDYAITVRNEGAQLTGLVANLAAVGAGTTIVDGQVNIGALGAGSTLTTGDTITLRHDRNVPFQPTALQWQFSAEASAFVALPGNPSDQAVDQVPEFRAAVTFSSAEIEQDPMNGVMVIRSKWVLGFNQGTTVGQINALLQSLGASIVRSYDRTAVLEVRVPDPGSLVAMEGSLATLRGNPIISFAMPAMVTPTNALPAILQSQAAPEFNRLAHHLAVKGASGWNGRRALPVGSTAGPLSLVVMDYFGNGALSSGLLAGVPTSSIGTGFLVDPGPSAHGYHVLGIAAASFDAVNDQADTSSITGMFAGRLPIALAVEDLAPTRSTCAPLGLIGLKSTCSGVLLEDRLRDLVRANDVAGGRMVINTSLGFNGNGGILTVTAEGLKLYWLRLLRGGFGTVPSASEQRFFHSASAGNNATLPASQNIGWTRAALDGSLSNTAVVENRSALSTAPFAAAGLASSSSRGGNISAIGSNTNPTFVDQGLWSYGSGAGLSIDRTPCLDQQGNPTICPMAGTSMAAPQVAGLAANLWALRPDFTSTQILQTIRSNAVSFPSGEPLIDAYATLLAADDPAALVGVMGDPSKAPMRLAVLDLDEDGQFTYADAVLFVDSFVRAAGASAYDALASTLTTVGSKKLDRTRFDLNGDGLLGGAGTGRFNLNIDYGAGRTPVFGTAQYEFLPQQVVQLTEATVTDFQILCYYVYSSLWREPQQKTRSDFEAYLQQQSPKLACGGSVVGVQIQLNDTASGWSGLPATITMGTLYTVNRLTFQSAGNSQTCNNQGEPLGERGVPLFSNTVDADAIFFGARIVNGVPWTSGVPNRNNCSSFFAYKFITDPNTGKPAGKFWANATGRAVFGFGGSVVSDWEYQVRYYSGDPALAYVDRNVTVGVVPGSGFYNPHFTATSTSLSWVLAPPTQ
jgi:Subtilase family